MRSVSCIIDTNERVGSNRRELTPETARQKERTMRLPIRSDILRPNDPCGFSPDHTPAIAAPYDILLMIGSAEDAVSYQPLREEVREDAEG